MPKFDLQAKMKNQMVVRAGCVLCIPVTFSVSVSILISYKQQLPSVKVINNVGFNCEVTSHIAL